MSPIFHLVVPAGFEPAIAIRLLSIISRALYHTELQDELVGETGFEPATPWPQTKCATKLRYSPFFLFNLTSLIEIGTVDDNRTRSEHRLSGLKGQ
jgi:hypothetical protein